MSDVVAIPEPALDYRIVEADENSNRLTIAEAKRRLAWSLGVPEVSIKITVEA